MEMDSRPIRLAALAAFLAAWLGAGLHAEPSSETEPCGCGPEPAFNSGCGGCERPADHHHHGGGDRHEHSTCPACKAFLFVFAAQQTIVDGARTGLACLPVQPSPPAADLLFSRSARGPPA